MYPWVDEMISHLHGQCPHRCAYCYVPNTRTARFYTGPLRLSDKSFAWKPRAASRTIFVDHMNDLFANPVPTEWILRVFEHCRTFCLGRTLVFQTKNPARYLEYLIAIELKKLDAICTPGILLGCTIETNQDFATYGGFAPRPIERYQQIMRLDRQQRRAQVFITVEPIMHMSPEQLAEMIIDINPAFVNIGADSKNHALPEPTDAEVEDLIARLRCGGVAIREKHNLGRLLP
jgi:DNA repair photolyase